MISEENHSQKKGLAQRGYLENALIFDAVMPLNSARFSNEPVRHKLHDALGDLALLGRPLEAQILLGNQAILFF